MEKQLDFAIIKEKIIKTDEVLRLFSKKDKEVKKLTQDNRAKTVEISRLKLENERYNYKREQVNVEINKLKETNASLNEKLASLQTDYEDRLNGLQYQLQAKYESGSPETVPKSPTKRKLKNGELKRNKLREYEDQELAIKEKDSLKQTLGLCQADNETLKLEIAKLKSQNVVLLEKQTIKVKKLESRVTILKTEMETEKSRYRKLELSNKDLNTQLETLKMQLVINRENVRKEEIKIINETHLAEIKTLQEKYSDEIKSLMENLKSTREHQDQLIIDNNNLNYQICKFEQEIRELAVKVKNYEDPSDEYVAEILGEMRIGSPLVPLGNDDQDAENERTRQDSGHPLSPSDENLLASTPQLLFVRNTLRRRRFKTRKRLKRKRPVDFLGALLALQKANIQFSISNEAPPVIPELQLRCSDECCRRRPTPLETNFNNATNSNATETKLDLSSPIVKQLRCDSNCCQLNTYYVVKGEGDDADFLGFLDVKDESNKCGRGKVKKFKKLKSCIRQKFEAAKANLKLNCKGHRIEIVKSLDSLSSVMKSDCNALIKPPDLLTERLNINNNNINSSRSESDCLSSNDCSEPVPANSSAEQANNNRINCLNSVPETLDINNTDYSRSDSQSCFELNSVNNSSDASGSLNIKINKTDCLNQNINSSRSEIDCLSSNSFSEPTPANSLININQQTDNRINCLNFLNNHTDNSRSDSQSCFEPNSGSSENLNETINDPTINKTDCLDSVDKNIDSSRSEIDSLEQITDLINVNTKELSLEQNQNADASVESVQKRPVSSQNRGEEPNIKSKTNVDTHKIFSQYKQFACKLIMPAKRSYMKKRFASPNPPAKPQPLIESEQLNDLAEDLALSEDESNPICDSPKTSRGAPKKKRLNPPKFQSSIITLKTVSKTSDDNDNNQPSADYMAPVKKRIAHQKIVITTPTKKPLIKTDNRIRKSPRLLARRKTVIKKQEESEENKFYNPLDELLNTTGIMKLKKPVNLRQNNLIASVNFIDICERDLGGPKSPSPEDKGDDPALLDVPKIIPLAKVKVMTKGTLLTLFNRLINYSTTEEAVDSVVARFSTQTPGRIAGMILSKISHDYYDKATLSKNSPFSPLMTDTQRIMLGFMARLEHSNVPIFEKFLELAEKKLLFCKCLKQLTPITRLYLAVCKYRKELHRIRSFCCSFFYFNDSLTVPFFFLILTSWTEVLPHYADAMNVPLARVLVQIIYTKSGGDNLVPLRNLFVMFYKYPSERWSSDELFLELFNNFKCNPIRSTDFPILLLCKYQLENWVYEKIETHFRPLVEQTEFPNYKATVIILIGNLVHRFNNDSEYLKKTIEWFYIIGRQKTTPEEVRDGLDLVLDRLELKLK